MFQIPAEQIGGAVVRRTFTTGGKRLTPGMQLSAEQVLAFPKLNRMALAEKRYIDLFPKNPNAVSGNGASKRYVVSAGFGRFHVIEGRKLNDEALDRDQAYALAGTAPKPVRKKAIEKE